MPVNVVVANVAPSLTASDVEDTAGVPVTLTARIDEITSSDAFTGSADWRNGSAPQTFALDEGTETFTLQHTFTAGSVHRPMTAI